MICVSNKKISRCHQYNPYLSSTIGKAKMRNILKAFVSANLGKLVYWQGFYKKIFSTFI